MLNTKEKNKLKKYLPQNYAVLVAQKVGVVERTVFRALNGPTKNPNTKILQELIKLAESEKLKKSLIKEKANKL